MKTPHWQDIPERGSRLGIAVLRAIMHFGGLGTIRYVLVPVAFYYLLTHRVARRASIDYIKRLSAYSEARGLDCALRANWPGVYRNIYSFAVSIAEKYAAWSGRYTLGGPPRVENEDVARQFTHSATGVVLLASHLGNFDVAIAFGAFDTKRRFRILIDHAGTRRFNNQRFSKMFHERVVFHDTQDVGPETAVELRQAIRDGDIVVIAADRLGPDKTAAVEARLLGGGVPLPIGPWIVAHLLECPVYAVFACREGREYRMMPYHICDRVHLAPRSNRRQALQGYAQLYANVVEEVMLRYPEQWYNFFQFWHEEA